MSKETKKLEVAEEVVEETKLEVSEEVEAEVEVEVEAEVEAEVEVEETPQKEKEVQLEMPEVFKVVVTADALNLRMEPTTKSKIIMVLDRGTECEFVKVVTQEDTQDKWLDVKVNTPSGKISGFVMKQFTKKA